MLSRQLALAFCAFPLLAIAPLSALAAAPAAPIVSTTPDFRFPGLTGGVVELAAYRGKAILVVNTASKCGFTPQYEGLQTLYDRYKNRGLVIIGVPSGDFGGQELGSSKEIAAFCKLNYGVTFPMAAKQSVVGPSAHPFYKWASARLGRKAVPEWNFHKILIGRDGRPLNAFPSGIAPLSKQMISAIETATR